MKIIGLNGRLHSGKDTALEYIKRAAGPGCRVHRTGFADKMKLSGVRALGFDPPTIEHAVAIADSIKDRGSITVDIGPQHKRSPNGEWAHADLHVVRITGREFWQRYGTEAHREVYGDWFHVDALLPQPTLRLADSDAALIERFPCTDVLVITDVRFLNEAERILNLGGTVWRIDADGRLGDLPAGAHVSERPLPPEYITVRVPNNGTLEQFEAAIYATWEVL